MADVALADLSRRSGVALLTRVRDWCGCELSPGSRRDRRTCSKSCRQAKSRFKVSRGPARHGEPLRLAYADPPYPGLARRYYGCDEVDHGQLVARLQEFDGWALSTSSEALQDVLALCPGGVRVAVWVNGGRHVRALGPRRAYEPVSVSPGRGRREAVVEDLSDVLAAGGRQHSHPGALVGMKPAAFSEWLFRLLGARQGDAFTDLFPGSGAVGRAWDLYASSGSSSDPLAQVSLLDRVRQVVG